MSSSEDVKTLFRRFGGEPDTYQEVVRDRDTLKSLGKWTMLAQVELNNPQMVPSVRRTVKGNATRTLLETTHAEIAAASLAVPAPAPVNVAASPAVPVVPSAPQPVAAQHIQVPQPVIARAAWTLNPPRTMPHTLAPIAAPVLPPTVATLPPAPEAAPRLSALAARLKAPVEVPEAEEATNRSHSLTGLFGRLSRPQPQSPLPGVLRRKFTK
jgi:hypothetical protein